MVWLGSFGVTPYETSMCYIRIFWRFPTFQYWHPVLLLIAMVGGLLSGHGKLQNLAEIPMSCLFSTGAWCLNIFKIRGCFKTLGTLFRYFLSDASSYLFTNYFDVKLSVPRLWPIYIYTYNRYIHIHIYIYIIFIFIFMWSLPPMTQNLLRDILEFIGSHEGSHFSGVLL